MLTTLRQRLSYANVVASIALFVALGGTSYAAVSLSSGSVRKEHIATGAVGKSEVRARAVGKSEIATGGVGKSEIRGNAVGNIEIKDDSVRGVEVLESSLGEVPSAAALQGKSASAFMANKVRVETGTAEPAAPGGTRSTSTASCETTERAISGGGTWVLADGTAAEDPDTTLTGSQPVVSSGETPGVTGWQVEGVNGDAAEPRSLRAFAVCVPKAP